jgi:serine/threonine-protein kinase 24/25/MST4
VRPSSSNFEIDAIPDNSRRDYEEDPDDMWDFGTVRHTGQTATMGRANAPPSPIAENGVLEYAASTTSSRSSTTVVMHNGNGMAHGGSRGSGESESADVNKTLPRASLEGEREIQGTVRRAAAPLGRREPSYEEDEEDEEQPQDATVDNPMHPSMLESVIMPAIASVCTLFPISIVQDVVLMSSIWFRCFPAWPPPKHDWHLRTCRGLLSRRSI